MKTVASDEKQRLRSNVRGGGLKISNHPITQVDNFPRTEPPTHVVCSPLQLVTRFWGLPAREAVRFSTVMATTLGGDSRHLLCSLYCIDKLSSNVKLAYEEGARD